jgi:hypothetical protein
MRIQQVDNIQERWCGVLKDLSNLAINTPECQRHVDQGRVKQIVKFQTDRIDAGNPPLFMGDIAILGRCNNGDLWIIDGQHRVAAACELVVAKPLTMTHPITVLVMHLSCPRSPITIRDAFVLVNSSVPVPDYIIDSSVSSMQRSTLRSVETELRHRFRPFFSNASRPRKPNVSMSALMSALAASSVRNSEQFPESPGHLVDFIEYANNRLEEEHPETLASISARQKSKIRPLFLSNDPTFDFVDAWLLQFISSASKSTVTLANNIKNEKVFQGRRSLSKALRMTVWNIAFTERSGTGACYCCQKEISQQAFECGHIIAVACGGTDTTTNLRPICAMCNRSIGAQNMDVFIRTYMNLKINENV